MPLTTDLKYAIVIPARFKSSRFPGKPLIDLNGKPMIEHVWLRCCDAVDKSLVYVATDNDQIERACQGFGANVIMTSADCKTGTDRVAEANLILDCDFLINVQGDEPLINPLDIRKVIDAYIANPGLVINAMCPIQTESEFRSFTIPKVIASKSGKLLYMSRAPIPVSKLNEFKQSNKQVCIYAFSKDHLRLFASATSKTPAEEIEDIEILRFLENDVEVHMVKVDAGNIAIDVPEDVKKVLDAMG